MNRIQIVLLLSLISFMAFSQDELEAADTVLQTRDSIRIKKSGKVITVASYAKRYQPRKALLYSAILPGAGQAYNKKYWKVPLVYGGFAVITYFVVVYNDYYSKYKNELYSMLESGSSSSSSGYSQEQLRSIIDQARRQRDFFLILDGLWYIIQIVDAHVDAHLREFDLNPQLKLSVEPSVQSNPLTGRMTGFALTLKF